jgi:hypothetical protein
MESVAPQWRLPGFIDQRLLRVHVKITTNISNPTKYVTIEIGRLLGEYMFNHLIP